MIKFKNIFSRPKLISTHVLVENEKSYEVKTYETSSAGELFQEKIEVNKDYYQSKINKLQDQIDIFNQRKNDCYE